jgi:hypothetical protein
MTPLEAPSAPSVVAGDHMPAFYPTYPQDQPIPMLIQTETGNQVVYMYPVMPNPQFAPAEFQQQQQPPKDAAQQ